MLYYQNYLSKGLDQTIYVAIRNVQFSKEVSTEMACLKGRFNISTSIGKKMKFVLSNAFFKEELPPGNIWSKVTV